MVHAYTDQACSSDGPRSGHGKRGGMNRTTRASFLTGLVAALAAIGCQAPAPTVARREVSFDIALAPWAALAVSVAFPGRAHLLAIGDQSGITAVKVTITGEA